MPTRYYYVCYTTKSRNSSPSVISYWDGVHRGDIADIILGIASYNENGKDKYYQDYRVIFYSEITEQQYDKLREKIG